MEDCAARFVVFIRTHFHETARQRIGSAAGIGTHKLAAVLEVEPAEFLKLPKKGTRRG